VSDSNLGYERENPGQRTVIPPGCKGHSSIVFVRLVWQRRQQVYPQEGMRNSEDCGKFERQGFERVWADLFEDDSPQDPQVEDSQLDLQALPKLHCVRLNDKRKEKMVGKEVWLRVWPGDLGNW
jgi:hypothetical protein